MIDETIVNHIEALAKKATQGTWMIDESHTSTYGIFRPHSDPLGEANIVSQGDDREECIEFGIERIEDAEYIAAVHPAFILELIEAFRNK